MSNPHRGEVTVELAGDRHTMRPTFQALAEIQDETGLGLMGLLLKIRDHSVKEIAAVLFHGINATEKVSRKDIENGLVEAGINNVIPSVVEFLNLALFAGQEEKKS